MEDDNPNRTILFDNWGLGETCWALTKIPRSDRPHLNFLHSSQSWTGIVALANLLDALILYDTVAFPEPNSDWWLRRSERLHDYLHMFKVAEIPRGKFNNIKSVSDEIFDQLNMPGIKPVVARGSIYYLLIGSFLGVPYQPSPKRMDFLADFWCEPAKDTAPQHLLRFFESESVRICSEIRNTLGVRIDSIRVPVVASYVFRNIDSLDQIVPVLNELRASGERRNLVEWLDRMNSHLADGNIVQYAKEFDAIRDIFDDLRKSMRLKEADTGSVKLGLSPSLDVNLSILARLFTRRKPHTILLKRFANHLLSSRTYLKDVNRLFGLDPDYLGGIQKKIEQFG